MSSNKSKEKIVNLLKRSEKVILLSHHNADPDGLGSALALSMGLKQKNIQTRIGVAESVSKLSKKLFKEYKIEINPEIEDKEVVLVLDTSSSEQLGEIEIKGKKTIVIDHHYPGNLKEKAHLSWINSEAKSVCELIYELLNELNCEFTPEISTFLILGISYDTGHLKYGDKNTFSILSKLLKYTDKDFNEILSLLYLPPDISERIAYLKAANRMDVYRIKDYLIIFSKIGSFEGSSARSLVRYGGDIAIVGCKRKNEIRISGRARREISEKMNLAEDIFSKIEPIIKGSAGGHSSAASANGRKPETMGKAFKVILNNLERYLGEKAEKII